MIRLARRLLTALIRSTVAAAILLPVLALAQQPVPPQTPPAAPPQQPPAAPQQQPPQQPPVQPSNDWSRLPRMQLERQFAGPLQDTIIQRWRDTVDGAICYIYLPITVQHSATTQSGFVQYGANFIGSISCMAAPVQARAPPPAKKQ